MQGFTTNSDISNMKVKYLCLDHSPMCLTLKYEHVSLVNKKCVSTSSSSSNLNWKSLQNKDINQYLINTDHLLNSIRLPAAIHCQNPNCTNQDHEQEIATLDQNITDCLQLAIQYKLHKTKELERISNSRLEFNIQRGL